MSAVPGAKLKGIALATPTGIARAFEDRIDLEIQLRDPFVDSKITKATIPIDQISSIDFYAGPIRKQLRVQAHSLDAVKDVPGANHGSFALHVKRGDQERASDFAEQVKWQLLNRTSTRTNVPRPPVKSLPTQVTEEDIVIFEERIKVPLGGLWVCTALQALAFIGFFIAGFVCILRLWSLGFEVDRHDHTWEMMPLFLSWSFGSLVTSILLFFVARNIKQHLNYPFVIAGLIVCIFLPFSPVTLTQIPFVIWGLIILCLKKSRDVFYSETMDRRLRDREQKTNLQRPTPSKAHIFVPAAIFVIAAGLLGFSFVISNIGFESHEQTELAPINTSTHDFFLFKIWIGVILLAALAYGMYRLVRAFSNQIEH